LEFFWSQGHSRRCWGLALCKFSPSMQSKRWGRWRR
jgi:hypothetical protein